MTDADKIAELTAQKEGLEFALKQATYTRDCQATIIARMTSESPALSQPILSAVVASEFAELRKLARMAHPGPWRAGATSLMAPETEDDLEITLRASNGNRDVLRQTTRYFAAANPATILRLLDLAALASAPAQPVAAIPDLFRNVTEVERTSDQSVRLVFTSCYQAGVFERAAKLANSLPAIPEAGQSVPAIKSRRMSLETLGALLPTETMWGDELWPDLLEDILDSHLATMSADAQSKGPNHE